MDHPEYTVRYSDDGGEWVATTSAFPSLSWLEASSTAALAGLVRLVVEVGRPRGAHDVRRTH